MVHLRVCIGGCFGWRRDPQWLIVKLTGKGQALFNFLDQIEQRLVANRDAFDLNGRRTVRAGGAGKDGVLTYDTPNGIDWTATYTGLSADDVARAVGGTSSSSGKTFAGAESRILWLGSQPLAAVELTIFENSDLTIPGPAAGVCFAPLEPADLAPPSTPTLTATQSGANAVQLTWGPGSTDDSYVYGYKIFQDGKAVANVGRAGVQQDRADFTRFSPTRDRWRGRGAVPFGCAGLRSGRQPEGVRAP